MNQEGIKRKLSGILSADVVEYSRLMRENEASTVRNLEENKKLIFKLVEEYEGRVVDAPRDNILAEFGSVVDAMQCAVSIRHINSFQLSAHSNAALEWWYFHGTFIDGQKGKSDFMVSVFKTTVSRHGKNITGFSCILDVRSDGQDKHYIVSQVDRNFFENYTHTKDRNFTSGEMNPVLMIILDEYKRSGPPRPIMVSDNKVITGTDPFSLNWDKIRIKQKRETIHISFTFPEQNQNYEFELNPVVETCSIPRIFSDNGVEGMDYDFIPRLELSGYVNKKPVRGSAWMDHQWGDTQWILKKSGGNEIRGWIWYGINFKDGSDLLIIKHISVSTGEEISCYGLFRKEGGRNRIISEIETIPLRFWESPETMIRYPVEMQIKLPELGAELIFSPSNDNQEIPFFGPIRAIWQGAGVIEGKIGTEQVSGRARCELNGYGYLLDFRDYLNRMGERIDSIIEGFLPKKLTEKHLHRYVGLPTWKYEPDAYTRMISEPVWDLISRKGKRWRPVFARLLLGAFGVDPVPYEELLYAVSELNHTGSLIIDDIEDNSLIRRGEEAIHLRYGSDLAINAANTLYFLPTILLFEHPLLNRNQKLEIYQMINTGMIRGHLGQGLDIYWSKYISPDNLEIWLNDSLESKLLQMYAFKTAAGLQGLAETAVIISRKNKKVRNACKEFAHALGVAFQIVDDINNFSNGKGWKKTCGEDLKEGKITYVVQKGLKLTNGSDRKFLSELLCFPELRKDKSHISEGIRIIRHSGALEQSRETAKEMVKEPWEKLSGFLPASDPKILLLILSNFLLDLSFNASKS